MNGLEVVSCASPFGVGGLGQHLAQAVAEARAIRPVRYFCTTPRAEDPAGTGVPMAAVARRLALPPARWDPGRRAHLWQDYFDREVAARLPAAEVVRAFSGQALRTFAAAAAACRHALECPTAHLAQVEARNRRASAAWPLERPWLGPAQLAKGLAEYEQADELRVVSRYAEESFQAAGVPAWRLCRRRLSVDLGRWRPPVTPRPAGPLRALFVGALSVTKGLPLLIEAFAQVPDPEAELTLCGGWSTVGMRRYLGRALARDRRLRRVWGDPLEHYQRANLYVHPSFQDGFGLAALEAAACGLPLVVSRDTGAAELLAAGEGGVVVPTGDRNALVDVLRLFGADVGVRARRGAEARALAERWVGGDARCASDITHTA